VADEFKIFTNVDSAVVDPKNFDAMNSFVDRKTDVCIIPPNSFALARTVEYFRIPRDVLVICLGKSTYARCGIIVNVTPLEPGWEGHVTLEFSNTTPLPAKIYANEGACQFLFLQGNEPCETAMPTARQIHGPARGDAAEALLSQNAYFLSVSPPKRLLKRATWPPWSILRVPPVHAGCDLGSISSAIVSPSLPQVERVWKVVPSVICTVMKW
jgi:deoxycytidine triphosphate deaminase